MASLPLHMRHNSVYEPFPSPDGRFNYQTQLKQVGDPKQTSSLPHDDYRINATEVRKVLRNRCQPGRLNAQNTRGPQETFPAAQSFKLLSEQGMKRVYYSEPLQRSGTTVCSA